MGTPVSAFPVIFTNPPKLNVTSLPKVDVEVPTNETPTSVAVFPCVNTCCKVWGVLVGPLDHFTPVFVETIICPAEPVLYTGVAGGVVVPSSISIAVVWAIFKFVELTRL